LGGRSVTDTLLDPDIVRQFRHKHLTSPEIARAMRHFKTPVADFLDAGADNMVMALEDGKILKITDKPWNDEWGHRTVTTEKGVVRFDHQIIGKPQTIDLLHDQATYYLQERAQTPVSLAAVRQFDNMIERDGTYKFWDKTLTGESKHGALQLGYMPLKSGKNSIVLLDYDAVTYPHLVPMKEGLSEPEDTLGDIRNNKFDFS
jgi:hypothetical protein